VRALKWPENQKSIDSQRLGCRLGKLARALIPVPQRGNQNVEQL
jgi:hypothetical protein